MTSGRGLWVGDWWEGLVWVGDWCWWEGMMGGAGVGR